MNCSTLTLKSTAILEKKFFLRAFLSFLLGAISAYSMAPTNSFIALLIGLSGLYLLLSYKQKTRYVFLSAYLFGFGYFLISLAWIGNALLVEGNAYAWARPLAVLGLPLLLSFFPALCLSLSTRITDLRSLKGYIAFVIALWISEWLRGHLFTGFPWNLYGYTWADTLEIAQVASIGGIYGLTFLSIFWASILGFVCVYNGSKRNKTSIAVLGTASFAVCFVFGAQRLANNPTQYHQNIAIRMVQPNILQHEKWDRQKLVGNFYKQLKLSYADNSDDVTTYIIWPETALSQLFINDRSSMEALKQMLRSYQGNAYLLSGVMRHELENEAYYNSLILFDKNGTTLQTYDKSHLVPFGEYIPFQKYIPFGPVSKFTGLQSGNGVQTQTTPEGLSYSPLVCYEVLFPGRVIAKDTPAPDVIINATNDAWYGISAGPHQHFAQAVFRAIEEKVPVVRSANTGISGAIDSFGRVLYRSNLFEVSAETLLLPK